MREPRTFLELASHCFQGSCRQAMLSESIGWVTGIRTPITWSRDSENDATLRAVGIFCAHCEQNARLRALCGAGFPQIVTSR